MIIENSLFTILQLYSKQTLQFDNLLPLMHLNESVWLPKIKSLAISEGYYSLIMVVLTILLFIGVSILTYKRRQFQEINLYLALSEVAKKSK